MKAGSFAVVISTVLVIAGCAKTEQKATIPGETGSSVTPGTVVEAVSVKKEFFEKNNHSVLDTKLDEPDFLDLSDDQVAAIADYLSKKPDKSFANLHNLAVINFIKSYQYNADIRASHRRDLDRMKPDYRYGTMGFLADLPLGISGDCFGGGISGGPPHVQLLKDGTLKGLVETNATIEDYTGTWDVRNGMLVVNFTVAVEDTGDTGATGKLRKFSFSDQRGFIIDRLRIFNQEGKICRLHQPETR